MSHFTVGVLQDGTKSVMELLAPYQENNMGDCPEEYLEFIDLYEQYRPKYETEEVRTVKFPDGSTLFPWETDELKKKVPFILLYDKNEKEHYQEPNWIKDSIGRGQTICFDLQAANAVLTEISFKELYPEYEDFLTDYIGVDFDEEQQKYGYWENPNAKWDWWQIGGRWKNLLKTKTGHKVDSAAIKDLEFTPSTDIIERYRKIWRVIVNNEQDDKISPWELHIFGDADNLLKTYGTEESFVDFQSAFSTFAVITPDGKWHEKGEIGWFGLSSATSDDEHDWKSCCRDERHAGSNPAHSATNPY